MANQQGDQPCVPVDSVATSKEVYNLLIGITGSVAAIKLVELVRRFKTLALASSGGANNVEEILDVNIKVVMTNNAKHFVSKEELAQGAISDIYDDSDEWTQWNKLSDPVLHIELRKWADLFLIAPLDANTMAKMANGICDNLLTCVVRAWDISKPLIYCPAMNVHMYNHPLTEQHFSKMQSFGYIKIDAIEKRLACGDYGIGGMASVETIVNFVLQKLKNINNSN